MEHEFLLLPNRGKVRVGRRRRNEADETFFVELANTVDAPFANAKVLGTTAITANRVSATEGDTRDTHAANQPCGCRRRVADG